MIYIYFVIYIVWYTSRRVFCDACKSFLLVTALIRKSMQTNPSKLDIVGLKQRMDYVLSFFQYAISKLRIAQVKQIANISAQCFLSTEYCCKYTTSVTPAVTTDTVIT